MFHVSSEPWTLPDPTPNSKISEPSPPNDVTFWKISVGLRNISQSQSLGKISEFDISHVFSLTYPHPKLVFCNPSPSRTSSKFFQVPRSIYGESNSFIFLCISPYFLHISSEFLHIFFIIPSFPLGPGTWENSDLSTYI